jgi:uncharacterized protein YkuJ
MVDLKCAVASQLLVLWLKCSATMRILIFATMVIFIPRTHCVAQAPPQVEVEKVRGSEQMSLDAATPGIRFEKLPQKLVEVTDFKQAYSFNLGDLRAESAYEIPVRLVNKTSEDIRPLKATTSCNCLVGSVPDQIIKPASSGEIVLRIRTKKYDSPIKQLVRLECANSIEIAIGLDGVIVPEFKASESEFAVERFDEQSRFEIVLVPQYDDIDMLSVELSPTAGVLKIVSSQTTSSGISAVLAVDQCPNDYVAREVLELRFKRKNDQVNLKTMGIGVKLRSQQTAMRPRIMVLHLDEKESDKSEFRTVKGVVSVLNLNTKNMPRLDDKCSIVLMDSQETIAGRFSRVGEDKNATQCELTFDMSSDLYEEFASSREFVPFTLMWGSVKLAGVKFFVTK